MKVIIVLVFSLLALPCYCVSQVMPASEPDNPGQLNALVHLYRPNAVYGIIWRYKVRINGQYDLKVKNKSWQTISVPAGETTLAVKDIGRRNLTLQTEPGQEYFVQTYLRRSVFLATPELVEVTPRFAKQQQALIQVTGN